MAVFSLAAAKNGRPRDAELLELAALACRESAEYADEGGATEIPAAPRQPVPADAKSRAGAPEAERGGDGSPPAVCCLCEAPGILARNNGGWICSTKRCPRYGVALPRDTFEGFPAHERPRLVQPTLPPVSGDAREPRQDRAGEGGDSQRPDTRENA